MQKKPTTKPVWKKPAPKNASRTKLTPEQIQEARTRARDALGMVGIPSPEERLKGIRLDIAHYRRPDPMTAPSKAKATGLYMICTIEKHRAERAGYADALMYDWRGHVAWGA